MLSIICHYLVTLVTHQLSPDNNFSNVIIGCASNQVVFVVQECLYEVYGVRIFHVLGAEVWLTYIHCLNHRCLCPDTELFNALAHCRREYVHLPMIAATSNNIRTFCKGSTMEMSLRSRNLKIVEVFQARKSVYVETIDKVIN